MKTIKLFFILFYLLGCKSTSKNNNQIDYLKNIDSVKLKILKTFEADSVLIYKHHLREEIYFSSLNCVFIEIYNAKTNILDFKKLPTDKYQRFNNYSEIEDSLKVEGLIIAKDFIKKYNDLKFDDLIIEFIKKDNKGKPIYRFICHYKEYR